MKGYGARLEAFAAKGPFTIMLKEDRRSPEVVLWWDATLYKKARESCDCCGNRRLRTRTVLKAEDETFYMVGSDCLDHLKEIEAAVHPIGYAYSGYTPPEEYIYNAE